MPSKYFTSTNSPTQTTRHKLSHTTTATPKPSTLLPPASANSLLAAPPPLPIPDDYKQVLQRQLDRLTTKEKTVIQQIATCSVTITELQKTLDLSPTDIIDVLQSLDRRGLLQRNTTDSEMSFRLSIAGGASGAIVLKDFLCN